MFVAVRPGRLAKKSGRVRMAMTTSSSAALPARSPRPLIVHSTCRAPFRTPASEFATAMPRSLWQCVLMTHLPMPGTSLLSLAMSCPYSYGST